MAWLPKKTVVVPIDFSGKSVEAVTTALELVEDRSGVHAVHVVVPLGNISPGMKWGAIDDRSRREGAAAHFQQFLSEHGFEGITTEVRVGNPGLEIADYAAETAAELIVIPSHGFSGVKRLVLGSVAEKVIRHARCPVLVLRRPDAA